MLTQHCWVEVSKHSELVVTADGRDDPLYVRVSEGRMYCRGSRSWIGAEKLIGLSSRRINDGVQVELVFEAPKAKG